MSQLVPIEQGSIPASVRSHPVGDLSEESIHDEIKGWLQFIKEEWTPLPDAEDDLRQRRSLIERWATADQSFRDSYDLRVSSQVSDPAAIESLPPLLEKRFICLAPVNRDTHPTNYAHLIKILIILSLGAGGTGGHPFSHAKASDGPSPQIPTFIAATSNLEVASQDLLAALYLQGADFRMVSMARTGTVLFHNLSNKLWLVIDQAGLDTGRLMLLQFQPNGQSLLSTLRRPCNLGDVIASHYGQGLGLEDIVEGNIGGPEHMNERLDISSPLLDILEGIEKRDELRSAGRGSRETWAKDIERCAPGYLGLEASGREVEFELECLEELLQ